MIDFAINKNVSYEYIIDKLLKYDISFYVDKKKNIILLENNNSILTSPHRMYITKNLSLCIDRFCSYDVFKILNLLLNLFAIGILDYCILVGSDG